MGFSDINQPWELGLKVSSPGHSWTQASHRAQKNIEKIFIMLMEVLGTRLFGFRGIM